MDENIAKLREMISASSYIVFFGGAGVSTESGIPDFRSVDGLYSQKYKYPPETIVSRSFLEREPEEFFRFYRDRLVYTDVKPNAAHLRLAELEREGKLKAVITQNIDGLHQAAGSRNVLELHGSAHRCFCASCGKQYPAAHMLESEGIPRCTCGGMVRPDVVLYGEQLDQTVLQESVEHLKKADMLIIGGTSLVVYPAAGLINYYHGRRLVLINKDGSASASFADLIIHGKIGEVLSRV